VLRVLICDGFRPEVAALTQMLEHDGDIAVAGHCPEAARVTGAVSRVAPDLVVIGPDLPDEDRRAAVEEIMATAPRPVLVLLSRRQEPPEAAAACLAAGALEASWQEELHLLDPAGDAGRAFRARVRLLGRARVAGQPARRRAPAGGQERPAGPGAVRPQWRRRAAVVGICASTGGPTILSALLAALPADYPVPILIVQHIARGFTEGLAHWLDMTVPLPVRLAADGAGLGTGASVAPEGAHLRLARTSRLALDGSAGPGPYQPSADVLFTSIAAVARRDGVAIVLTGMGEDGAAGAAAVREAGGTAIAQDERSSAIFGMPKAAISRGVSSVLSPPEIAAFLLSLEHQPLGRAS